MKLKVSIFFIIPIIWQRMVRDRGLRWPALGHATKKGWQDWIQVLFPQHRACPGAPCLSLADEGSVAVRAAHPAHLPPRSQARHLKMQNAHNKQPCKCAHSQKWIYPDGSSLGDHLAMECVQPIRRQMPATLCSHDMIEFHCWAVARQKPYMVSTCQDWLALMPAACQTWQAQCCSPRGSILAPNITPNVLLMGHNSTTPTGKKPRNNTLLWPLSFPTLPLFQGQFKLPSIIHTAMPTLAIWPWTGYVMSLSLSALS